MDKKYLLLLLLMIPLVLAYTPSDKHDIKLILDAGYNTPNNHNINLVLSDTGVVEEGEIIYNVDLCKAIGKETYYLTTNCNITKQNDKIMIKGNKCKIICSN